MASIVAAAPQLLVEKLTDSLAFYETPGFSRDFVRMRHGVTHRRPWSRW